MKYLDWVKLDFVLAVLLTVVLPLFLLFLSIHKKPLLYRLLAYWRVSALLAISVYLLMAELGIGLLTGMVARLLILPVLWLGDGLMHSSHSLPKSKSKIYRFFRGWRVTVSVYCMLGVLFTLPLLPCSLSGHITERCAAWFVPPQMFGSLLHDHRIWETLGEYALIALGVYAIYLLISVFRLVSGRLS